MLFIPTTPTDLAQGRRAVDVKIILLGLFVGFMVGLTGTGGGALMTPLLILLGWARPLVAVGTDLVWATFTKLTGAGMHWRQKSVDFTLVKSLALGSLPGAIAGMILLRHIASADKHQADRLSMHVLGGALVVVAITMFIRCLRRRAPVAAGIIGTTRGRRHLTAAIGVIVGFVVSLSSVGSGSLIIAALVMLYPEMPMRQIVGSDIANALLMTGTAALGHLSLGEINFGMVATLLVGSIPGVLIGSRLTVKIPDMALRPVLATTLLALGCKLL